MGSYAGLLKDERATICIISMRGACLRELLLNVICHGYVRSWTIYDIHLNNWSVCRTPITIHGNLSKAVNGAVVTVDYLSVEGFGRLITVFGM